VEDTKNSYGWQAATLNPAQLTLSIHTENKSLGGYELYAWAPVHKVMDANDGKWIVQTPRGSVLADKVIYATNAYSQALIPELEGLITPMRGTFRTQMHAKPQLKLSSSRLLPLAQKLSRLWKLHSEPIPPISLHLSSPNVAHFDTYFNTSTL